MSKAGIPEYQEGLHSESAIVFALAPCGEPTSMVGSDPVSPPESLRWATEQHTDSEIRSS